MARRRRHNVFVSYYHDQEERDKERFVRMMGDNIIDRSVNIGDILGPNPPTEATLQRIREEFIAQVSVTVVLIGRCSWQRKYVDWEIGASLRDTPETRRQILDADCWASCYPVIRTLGQPPIVAN